MNVPHSTLIRRHADREVTICCKSNFDIRAIRFDFYTRQINPW